MSEPDHLPQLLAGKSGSATNTESAHTVEVRNTGTGASITQIGFSEKWMIVVLLLVAFSALIFAVWGFHESGVALSTSVNENTLLRENMRSDFDRMRESHTAEIAALREVVRTNNAKIEILQYDHNALKAQLVAKGIYQATEH